MHTHTHRGYIITFSQSHRHTYTHPHPHIYAYTHTGTWNCSFEPQMKYPDIAVAMYTTYNYKLISNTCTSNTTLLNFLQQSHCFQFQRSVIFHRIWIKKILCILLILQVTVTTNGMLSYNVSLANSTDSSQDNEMQNLELKWGSQSHSQWQT